MMNKKLIFSRYTHKFEKDNLTAYYNSLQLQPVFIDKDFVKIFSCFKNEVNVDVFLAKFSCNETREYINSIITSFIENKILVGGKSDDEDMIAFHRAKIVEPYVHVAFFLLTNDCNFSCKYCFVREPMTEHFETLTMTNETALKGLNLYAELINRDEALLQKEKAIVFYGGEPLMNLSVLKFTIEKIEKYKLEDKLPKHLKLLMVTNGSLITNEIADFLKQHNITVTFSVDGDREENKLRTFSSGKEAFDSTLNGYQICMNKNIDINVACTLTPNNISNPEKTINSFVDFYKVKRIGFNMLLDNGINEVPEEYNQKASNFILQAHKVFRKNGIRENRMARKLSAFENSEVYLYDCMAGGGRQISIAPNGEIGICHEDTWNKKNYVGNVYDDRFNPAENKDYLVWAERTPLNMEECHDCPALGICGGGCLINAKHKGSIWNIDERFCVQSKTILEWMIWDLVDEEE